MSIVQMGQYSIKDLEKLSGIKAHTIRIWEKRHNLVSPKRTDTNIRFYTDDDVRKILNVSTLNKNGYKISHIAPLTAQLIELEVQKVLNTSLDFDPHINDLIAAMVKLDEVIFEQKFNSSIKKFGFEKTITSVVYPLLEKIGVLWLTGNIHPAQEHFLSNFIKRKLFTAIDAQSSKSYTKKDIYILYLPEHDLHELGLLFYYYVIRKRGYKTYFLGQCVPTDSLLKVIDETGAKNLVSSWIAPTPQKDILKHVADIKKCYPKSNITLTGGQLSTMGNSEEYTIVSSQELFNQFVADL